MPLYETTTLYDTLGVVPAAKPWDIAKAYRNAVVKMLDDDFYARSGTRHFQEACAVAKLTAAFVVLCSSERRLGYDRKLIARGLICPVCQGSGEILDRERGLKPALPCAACDETGKGWDFNAIPQQR